MTLDLMEKFDPVGIARRCTVQKKTEAQKKSFLLREMSECYAFKPVGRTGEYNQPPRSLSCIPIDNVCEKSFNLFGGRTFIRCTEQKKPNIGLDVSLQRNLLMPHSTFPLFLFLSVSLSLFRNWSQALSLSFLQGEKIFQVSAF